MLFNTSALATPRGRKHTFEYEINKNHNYYYYLIYLEPQKLNGRTAVQIILDTLDNSNILKKNTYDTNYEQYNDEI